MRENREIVMVCQLGSVPKPNPWAKIGTPIKTKEKRIEMSEEKISAESFRAGAQADEENASLAIFLFLYRAKKNFAVSAVWGSRSVLRRSVKSCTSLIKKNGGRE
jgi:hypothetical protein